MHSWSEGEKRVLVAPLEWGLGHATRCIPLIRELKLLGAEVFIAADGEAYELLKGEFPDANLIRMPGYRIVYPKGYNMAGKLFLQLPRIVSGILREHRQLAQIIKEYHIGGVISDNRYGLWNSRVVTVFMTHQLRVKVRSKGGLAEAMLHRIIRLFISKYTMCWIPDLEEDSNLSGELSHGDKYEPATETYYIGPLSRFSRKGHVNERYDVAVILSGPEPQRSFFEEKVKPQVLESGLKTVIVKGVPSREETVELSDKVSLINHMDADQLNEVMMAADVIVSRPGYSTVMDLAVLGKPAIFVPTPGQTEQEYLAERFFEKGIFFRQSQDEFDIQSALREVPGYSGIKLDMEQTTIFRKHVADFVERIR